MKNFTCQICSKLHQVYYSTTSPLPDLISNLNGEERGARLNKLSDLFYVLDNQKLITKGDIRIEIESNNDFLELISWCSIDLIQFNANFKKLQQGDDVKMTGLLLSEYPFYEQSKSLKIELLLNISQERGIINLLEKSQLRTDQIKPIDDTRLIEIMQSFQHPELWSMNDSTGSQISQTIEQIIKTAQTEFISKNRLFIIDISHQRQVLFQIVSNSMLEDSGSHGFGLHIANDQSHHDYQTIKKKMESVDFANRKVVDGIEIYQQDYGKDTVHIKSEIIYILDKVFGLNIEVCEIEIYEL